MGIEESRRWANLSSTVDFDTSQGVKTFTKPDEKTWRTAKQFFTYKKLKIDENTTIYVNRRSLRNFLSQNPSLRTELGIKWYTSIKTIVKQLQEKHITPVQNTPVQTPKERIQLEFAMLCSNNLQENENPEGKLLDIFKEDIRTWTKYLPELLSSLKKCTDNYTKQEITYALMDKMPYFADEINNAYDFFLQCDDEIIFKAFLDKTKQDVDLLKIMCEKGACTKNIDIVLENFIDKLNSCPTQFAKQLDPPITRAIENQQKEVVKALLKKNVAMDTKSTNWTKFRTEGLLPIEMAVKKGDAEIVSLILKKTTEQNVSLPENIISTAITANAKDEIFTALIQATAPVSFQMILDAVKSDLSNDVCKALFMNFKGTLTQTNISSIIDAFLCHKRAYRIDAFKHFWNSVPENNRNTVECLSTVIGVKRDVGITEKAFQKRKEIITKCINGNTN